MIEEAYAKPICPRTLGQGGQNLFNVSKAPEENYEGSYELVKQAVSRIEEISKREGLSGVPSGFKGVDRVTPDGRNRT